MIPDKTRRRVLFLGHTVPYPPTRGGFIRSYNVLRILAQEYDVRILCFERVGSARFKTSADRAGAIEHLTSLGPTEIVPVPQATSTRAMLWDHTRSLLTGRVFTYYRYDSTLFREKLEARLHEDVDLVHVDSLDLVRILPMLSHQMVVCTHHNVESELLMDRARASRSWPVRMYIGHQARLQRMAEQYWCPRVALNVTVSERDARVLKGIAGGNGRYKVIPNGVDVRQVTPGNGSGIDILGLGGLEWFPNRDAADYLGAVILPVLQKMTKQPLSVTWVGSMPDEARALLEGAYGINCPGFVDDVRPYINRATCYVLPYRLGGGTRLKMLEALASGAAIVTTSMGALGVDIQHGVNALLADDPDEFARAILCILQNPSLRASLGANARKTAVERYSWEGIGQKLTACYSQLMKQTPERTGP